MAACALLAIGFTGCSDEFNEPVGDGNNPNPDSIELPGSFTVQLNKVGQNTSRASFDDGDYSEYRFAPTEKATDGSKTYHHFMVVYSKGDGSLKGVFPLDMPNKDELGWNFESPEHDYLTLTASTLICSKDFPESADIQKPEDMVTFLTNTRAYFLINVNESDFMTGSHAAGLSSYSETDLKNCSLKNYSIQVGGTEYFTMSNSVYLNGNTVVCPSDINISEENIYATEEDAKTAIKNRSAKPITTGYVERMAVKYTIKFANSGNGASSSAEGLEKLAWESIDESTGLPIYSATINEYDGITFDALNGYSIKTKPLTVKIRVFGYGVDNLEPGSFLFKDINEGRTTFFRDWNAPAAYRTYWCRDAHYTLAKGAGKISNAEGYPHQFRQALDTDSITSFASGNYTYNLKPGTSGPFTVTTSSDGTQIRNYYTLGEPEKDGDGEYTINVDCYLEYRSFNTLASIFATADREKSWPVYSTENTYHDPGMTVNGVNGGSWAWGTDGWKREAFSVATNMVLICEIESNNTPTTLYRGQNNEYYHALRDPENGVLDSKLQILNTVMLTGGNAGLQVLHGQWDRHTRWEDDDANQNQDTHLDKVAWNEGSYLWIGEDRDGGRTYRRATANDLTLIPGEISGGDGQCLIAPAEEVMGENFRYYLAPASQNSDQVIDLDPGIDGKTKIVEISYNHLVALIHKVIGPIDVFTEGKMYYSVPVPHVAQTFVESAPTKAEETWRTLGNVGVVRNNWYEFTVEEISGIGTPVHDLNQPIVPVMDVRRSYINLGVRLIDWHRIWQGNVPVQ